MSHFPTPGLKHTVDVVPANLPLPGVLIAAAIGCTTTVLATLAMATIWQLSGLSLSSWLMVMVAVFGFIMPSVNLYLISRASLVARWCLAVNLVGAVVSFLFLYDRYYSSGLSLGMASASIAAVAAGLCALFGTRRVNWYYKTIRTGEVADDRVLQTVFPERWARRIDKLIYPVGEALLIVVALLVFCSLLFVDKLS